MTEIKTLIQKYSLDLNSFELAKQEYYTYCNVVNNPEFSKERARHAYEALCKKFQELLEVYAHEADLKERADIYLGSERIGTPMVAFSTSVSKIDITIGLFRDFYMATTIKNPHNIKYMPDEFWILLFELGSLGRFNFSEIEKPTKEMRTKHPQMFNKRGNYFKLLRNYFLYEADYGMIRGLGNIAISLDNKTPFEELIVSFSKVFRIMYRLNLLLVHAERK